MRPKKGVIRILYRKSEYPKLQIKIGKEASNHLRGGSIKLNIRFRCIKEKKFAQRNE